MEKIKLHLLLVFGFASISNAAIIHVSLDTSALVADSADQPFSVEFDLENGALISSNQDGGPFTNASNVVTISDFSFGGGAALDTSDATYLADGGGSGDIRSTVTLLANRSSNYLSQGFTPGSRLSFTVNYTNNVANSDILDSFNFGILDSSFLEVPTQGGDIFDSFLQIDFNGVNPQITTFASDPALVTSAGNSLTIAAPSITSPTGVPEPGTIFLIGAALLLTVSLKIRHLPRKRLPIAAGALSMFVFTLSSSRPMAAQSQGPEIFTEAANGKTISYQIIDGFAVAQGDMAIGTASAHTDGKGRRKATLVKFVTDSNTVNIASRLWPKVNGVVTVPYITTKSSANMTNAINAFNTLFSGKFQWVARGTQRDYVDINLAGQSSNSCFATLGYTRGKEILQGTDGCSTSALLHEMGHIMGFAHEQSRANRNSYLSIDFDNIAPSSRSQYSQDFADTMDLELYDFGSIMHYGPRGFTRNGNPEMESIPVGIQFGSSRTYSSGDIDALNRLYFSPPNVVTVTSNPAGLQILVDGAPYTSPQTFSWALNSTHTLAVPDGPQTINGSPYLFGRWNSDLNGDFNSGRTITVSPGSGALGSPASFPAVTCYAVNYVQLTNFNPVPVLDGFVSTSNQAGTVTTNPAPVTYPGITGQYFVARQLVTLSATPASGNTFYGFEGTGIQVFGAATNPVTLPSDVITGNLQVDFSSMPQVTVSTNITNNNASGVAVAADSGTPKALPAAFALGYDTGWDAGSTHTLSASTPASPFYDPKTRYVFAGWSDGVTSTDRTVTVPPGGLSLGTNYNVLFRVTANTNAACAGTATVSPALPADGYVASGTPLTFSANPAAPFLFVGWTGTFTGPANPLNLTANAEVIGTANFNLVAEPITLTSVSPLSVSQGSAVRTITVSGTGFATSTVFFLGETSRTVAYVDQHTITVTLNDPDVATPGSFGATVANYQGNCSVSASGPPFVVTP